MVVLVPVDGLFPEPLSFIHRLSFPHAMACLSRNGHGGKLHGCSGRGQLLVDGPYGSRIDPRGDATSQARFSGPQGFTLRPERLPGKLPGGRLPCEATRVSNALVLCPCEAAGQIIEVIALHTLFIQPMPLENRTAHSA